MVVIDAACYFILEVNNKTCLIENGGGGGGGKVAGSRVYQWQH